MKTKDISYIVVFLVIVALMRGCDKPKIEEVIYHDTIKVDNPIHDTIIKEHQRIVRIPAEYVDITEDDTIYLVDAETKHYKDSTYECWVSGVDPSLDSIRVYNRTIVKTITKEVPKYISLGWERPKTTHFGGFVGANSSFDINYVNLQGGLELQVKKFDFRVGYNIGEHNYPFFGVEYKIR